MSDRKAVQMSGTHYFKDISRTENVSHVYVKVDKPQSLCPNFEGPYPIVDRPSRSQVTVKIGTFKNGEPPLQTYNWQSCKIGHLREGAAEGSRPALGRKPASGGHASVPSDGQTTTDAAGGNEPVPWEEKCQQTSPADPFPPIFPSTITNRDGAQIQTANPPSQNVTARRPVRSTRNPNPVYTN